MLIERLGDFSLGWGESLVWDDRAERLYFVDCAAQTLHWLDGGRGPLHTISLPSMAAGIVPTEDGRLVGALDDGLHLIDPEAGTTEFVTAYPAGLGARANDACADLSGNLITGTLNMGPAEGSSWWYSARDGWRLLDPDISNTNGPNVCVLDGAMTLFIGDSALDTDGGLWCALFGGSQLVRFTPDGLDRTLALPVANPADVAFGGPELDRLYVVSVQLGAPEGGIDGALLVVDGLGVRGRPEPRFAVA